MPTFAEVDEGGGEVSMTTAKSVLMQIWSWGRMDGHRVAADVYVTELTKRARHRISLAGGMAGTCKYDCQLG